MNIMKLIVEHELKVLMLWAQINANTVEINHVMICKISDKF